MGDYFDDIVTSVEALRTLYALPTRVTTSKKVDHLDPGSCEIIGACPLVVTATADAAGRCTVSPRGGLPGFVTVLDRRHLAIPDYAGNNLLDSLQNLVENPRIGLLFVLPGRRETLRVNGSACITTSARVLDRCLADRTRRPTSAVGVTVECVFVHCSSSLTRARVWEPESWEPHRVPSAHEVTVAHLRSTMAEEDLPAWARP